MAYKMTGNPKDTGSMEVSGNTPYVRGEDDPITQFEMNLNPSPARKGHASEFRLSGNPNVFDASKVGLPGTYSTPNRDRLANAIMDSKPGERRDSLVDAFKRQTEIMNTKLMNE